MQGEHGPGAVGGVNGHCDTLGGYFGQNDGPVGAFAHHRPVHLSGNGREDNAARPAAIGLPLRYCIALWVKELPRCDDGLAPAVERLHTHPAGQARHPGAAFGQGAEGHAIGGGGVVG